MNSPDSIGNQKFGTFMGVFIPSILTILGVIMYLRMGWVVANAGFFGTIIIVTISTLITFLTTLSISATATNMKVKGGGAYYMVSRSFGVEAGAAVGIPIFLAQALGIAFYIAGFAESVQPYFPEVSTQSIGLIALVVLTGVALWSPSIALKTQIIIFIIIGLSLISIFGGSPVGDFKLRYDGETAGFWAVFALFFPAVTGILSGVSMSGDLKDPGRSIPRGTLAAVLVGYVVYIAVPAFLFFYATQEQLLKDPMIATEIAIVPQLVLLGIWGATLSSALGSLLAAPRTLQALALDKVAPSFFGRTSGGNKDPRIATAFTFVLAAFGISLGNLDVIAPILTMFFLTSYGVLNFIAGIETLVSNPSWRPTFKVHWILSFIGTFFCFGVMMMIDAGAAYMAFAFIVLVYFYIRKLGINAHWTDIRRGVILFFARNSIYALEKFKNEARSWRPNIMVLSGSPKSRMYLIQLADAISHGKGFLTVCSIIRDQNFNEEKRVRLEKSVNDFLSKNEIPALTKVKQTEDEMHVAIRGLCEDHGVGAVVPNTYVMGETTNPEKYLSFAKTLKTIYGAQKNLLIMRQGIRAFENGKLDRLHEKRDKVIDLWWGRESKNSNLLLVIAYMLQTSPEWAGSTLRVRSLVKEASEIKGVVGRLNHIFEEGRLPLEPDVIVGTNLPPLEQIGRLSAGADMVMLGLNPPDEDLNDPETYARYYAKFVELTKHFPTTLVALAGEKVELKEVFSSG